MQQHPSTGKNKTSIKGSFLLELLVSFAIISIAMTVVVDSFVTSQRGYRITAEKADLARALTRVLEDISVQARLSENFRCGGTLSPCTGSNFSMTHIENLNSQGAGEVVQYRLSGGVIQRNYLGGGFEDMTPPNITVSNFLVVTKGTAPDDDLQALVTTTAHETADSSNSITLQTSFVERPY